MLSQGVLTYCLVSCLDAEPAISHRGLAGRVNRRVQVRSGELREGKCEF